MQQSITSTPHPCPSVVGIICHCTEERVERADRQGEAQERDLVSSQEKDNAKARLRNVAAYGHMAIKAGRLAAKTRQTVTKAAEDSSERDRLKEEMAVVAMGASHTEQQLLRASRLGVVHDMTSRAGQSCFMY